MFVLVPEAARAMPSTRMRNPRPSHVRRKAFSLGFCCWSCESAFGESREGFSMGDLRITVALGLFLFFFLSFFEEEEEEEEPKPRAFSVEDLGEEGLLPSLSLSSSASCFSADASDLTATAEVILLFVVVVVELLEMEIGEIEGERRE